MAPSGRIHLRNVLESQNVAFGAWQCIPSSLVSRLLVSATSDLSWILLDAEHGLINDSHFYDLANAIASQKVSPIIRVPIGQDWWIKRALDAGAHGIMVPMVHDANMARDIVSYTKYPPAGIRGFGPAFTHAAGATMFPYAATANEDILVIVQIESPEAVKNIDEIAAVEGVDVIFVGPFDLALSLGIQFGSDEHKAVISKLLSACQKANKHAAILSVSGKDGALRKEQGFNMISITADSDLITSGIKAHTQDALGKSVV